MEIIRQGSEVGSLLPPCKGWNSGCQAWWQVPLLPKPSRQPQYGPKLGHAQNLQRKRQLEIKPKFVQGPTFIIRFKPINFHWLLFFLVESVFAAPSYRGLEICKENRFSCLITLVAGASQQHGAGIRERELAMCTRALLAKQPCFIISCSPRN